MSSFSSDGKVYSMQLYVTHIIVISSSFNGKVYSIQLYVTHLNYEFAFFQWYGVLNTTLCDSLKLWVRFLPMVMWAQYTSMWLNSFVSSFPDDGKVHAIQLYMTKFVSNFPIFTLWAYQLINVIPEVLTILDI